MRVRPVPVLLVSALLACGLTLAHLGDSHHPPEPPPPKPEKDTDDRKE